VAGLVRWTKAAGLLPSDRVVCVLTGHGLKDPDTAVKRSPKPTSVEAKLDQVLGAMGL
jgi:threonine synthase